jgi:DNA polymerase III epsilon subunit-like protein
MRWTQLPIHVIDFEGSIASGILEYGVVTLRGGLVVETQTRICRATGQVRAEDEALHGLSAEAVEMAAPFADEFARFAVLRTSGPFAAHYAQAENSLIKSVWPYTRASPDFARPELGTSVTEWGPWIDTGRVYTELFTQLRTGRLTDLVQIFGLQTELDALASEHCPLERRRYHAALYDALGAALLLLSLGSHPEFSQMTVPWLLQMSTANPAKREALRQDELF